MGRASQGYSREQKLILHIVPLKKQTEGIALGTTPFSLNDHQIKVLIIRQPGGPP